MARSRQASTAAQVIAYAKIFPPIGIARVGDSENEFFFGPEFQPAVSERPEDHRYRDAEGRIKRQAARFRIYGFDAQDRVICELTSDRATTTWKVHLANKKAAWFEFNGAAEAAQQFAGDQEVDTRAVRNAGTGKIEFNQAIGRFESNDERKPLEIDGGKKVILGANQGPRKAPDGDDRRFKGFFKRGVKDFVGHEVYLGELRTDAAGRLIVLGGRGTSEPVGPNGVASGDERLKFWIDNYANNDHWHDDVSDGPVTATVVLKDGSEIPVEGAAWVIVAPPDFAPDVTNLVTLYDVMEETAIAGRLQPKGGCPPLRGLDSVSFRNDIQPILERMNDYRWTSPLGLRGHGYRKPGEADPASLSQRSAEGGPQKASEQEARERFFNVLRVPNYPALDPVTGKPAKIDVDLAVSQATSFYMPPLSGDQGGRTPGIPETWFTLTRLQYGRMHKWKEGEIVEDKAAAPEKEDDQLQQQPARLTRCALEACAGGAFFPGIEMTVVARDPSLYSEPFRIDHARVQAGDITKYMACPWQADFYECRDDWWPAQRPDEVITDLTFSELLKSFEAERESGAGMEAILFRRERWDRGLDKAPRPSRNVLVDELLPLPENGDADKYVNRLARRATALLFSLGGAGDYIGYERDPLTSGSEAERLPNPWRLQYQTQEQLDGYAGRYFLPSVPSPEDVLNPSNFPSEFRSIPSAKSLSDIRRNWTTLRVTHPAFAGFIAGTYAIAMRSALFDYFREVIVYTPAPRDGKEAQDSPALQVRFNLRNAPTDPLEEPQDFPDDSDAYRRLRGGEFLDQLVSRLFLVRSVQSPDMSMVDNWRHLGFVRKKTITSHGSKVIPAITVQIETERDKYDGKSYRDYFYYLLNVEEFPDFIPYAKVLAERFLNSARALIEEKGIFDRRHPESLVPYTPANFAAKTEQIYEIMRRQADQPQRYVYRGTRSDRAQGLLVFAPFNQTDGAWLRYAANAGTIDEVKSLLFAIWSDEIGNGDPALHHGNLYTVLLKSLGVYLPEVTSRAYADDSRLDETTFVQAVFQLAISQHSQEFLPEILGMTLLLEWEALTLVPGIKRLDYFGIDSQFFRMHVGIDNATEGHGAKAKRAIELYLDQVFRDSGAEAQQEHWKRIWRGFVAFATTGYDLFQNLESMSIEDERSRHTRTPADRLADIIDRKRHYGSLNHLRNRLGLYRINDLFDAPALFLDELANSPWIEPGSPSESRFLNLLVTFQGPMYKIFSEQDLAAWREWIEWLGEEGDTLRPKRHVPRAEAMMILLVELRHLMIASPGHHIYHVPKKSGDGEGRRLLLAELFKKVDPKEVMRILKDPENGWVVPFRAAESALIVDLMRPARPMGAAVDRRIAQLFGQVGRMVAYEWIAAGCPIPGEPEPDLSQTIITKRPPPRLLVQQYGMGAVH